MSAAEWLQYAYWWSRNLREAGCRGPMICAGDVVWTPCYWPMPPQADNDSHASVE